MCVGMAQIQTPARNLHGTGHKFPRDGTGQFIFEIMTGRDVQSTRDGTGRKYHTPTRTNKWSHQVVLKVDTVASEAGNQYPAHRSM